MLTSATRGEALTPNPNECNSTLMSGTSGGTVPTYTMYTGVGVNYLTLRVQFYANECYSTLTSETRDINLTRRNRYPVQKSILLIRPSFNPSTMKIILSVGISKHLADVFLVLFN